MSTETKQPQALWHQILCDECDKVIGYAEFGARDDEYSHYCEMCWIKVHPTLESCRCNLPEFYPDRFCSECANEDSHDIKCSKYSGD